MATEHSRTNTEGEKNRLRERTIESDREHERSRETTSEPSRNGDGDAETEPDRNESDTHESRDDSDTEDDPYEIRLYEPRDREGFLELYDQVLGERDDEWFAWKYEDNPYTDHVPIVLAAVDGQVVGTKPCFALELRAGEETVIGYQPADVMVHPDHRRRGLYSRTTERMKEHYREREPSLFFNFPNQATLSGSLKHGWKVVEEVPTHYRIQRPSAIVDSSNERQSRLARLAQPIASGYLRVRDALVSSPDEISVERFEDVPVDTFVELYERAIPRTLHANRDETFYGWRFGNPKWTYDAYVATRYGEPIAGVVTGTQVRDGSRVTELTDVVPLGETEGRTDGLTAILTRVIEDHSDADVLAASGDVLPSTVRSQFEFHSDGSFPLSRLSSRTTQVAYPIADDGGHEWTVENFAITDPSNWTVTYAEQDTS